MDEIMGGTIMSLASRMMDEMSYINCPICNHQFKGFKSYKMHLFDKHTMTELAEALQRLGYEVNLTKDQEEEV